MEKDIRQFLLFIANSIATILLWMILQVFMGIYMEWGFFEDKPGWKNILYYAFVIISLWLIIRRIRKKWTLLQ